MTFQSFDIFINSGSIGAIHYTEDDNIVENISVTNSDQDYYQNGTIGVYSPDTLASIGNPISIYINNNLLFDGYVSRKSITQIGTEHVVYQLIGRTYDLWRHYISESYTYTGNTAYIVSSLVSEYCDDVSASSIDISKGEYIEAGLDFKNQTVGEALVTLTGYDGFSFYVSISGQLIYTHPSSGYLFSITDADILEMSPIEESDDDLTNSCLLIGATDYITTSKQLVSSNRFPLTGNIKFASSFVAEGDTLSAVKLALDRTVDPNQPTNLSFAIYTDSAPSIFEDDFDDETYLSTLYQTKVIGSKLILDYEDTLITNYVVYHTNSESSQLSGIMQLYNPPIDTVITQWNFYSFYVYTAGYFTARIRTGTTILYESESWLNVGWHGSEYTGYYNIDYPFVKLQAGVEYAFEIYSTVWTGAGGKMQYPGYSTEDSADWGASYGRPAGASSWSSFPYELLVKFYRADFYTTGYAKSTLYKNIPTKYIRISGETYISGTRIRYSGSINGINWSGLTNGASYTFHKSTGTSSQVKYIFSSNGRYSPAIEFAELKSADSSGWTGNPGSKIELSDDISFSVSDIPYNPQWTDWKSYTSPKLILSEGMTYWLVLSYISTNSEKWWCYYISGPTYQPLKKSSNGGLWEKLRTYGSSGQITSELGWEMGEITGYAENQESIDRYGKHFKRIQDSNLTTQSQVDTKAEFEVDGSENLLKQGYFVIEGRTDVKVGYNISANLSNLNIYEGVNIVSYSHQLNPKKGYTTSLNYGKHPFDITKKITDLEEAVGEIA